MHAKSKAKQGGSPNFLVLLGAVAVIGAGVIWWVTRPAAPVAIALDPSVPLPQAEGHVYGSDSAPVTIMEFADFECPGCASFSALAGRDIKERLVPTGNVRFVFFDFPLNIHANAPAAHLAAGCAAEQGKFWEMHDQLFAGQFDWNTQATSNPRPIFTEYAKTVGVNVDEWNACYDAQRPLARIEANRNYGIAQQVGSTPTIAIEGQLYPGGLSGDQIKQIVDSILAARAAVVAGGE